MTKSSELEHLRAELAELRARLDRVEALAVPATVEGLRAQIQAENRGTLLGADMMSPMERDALDQRRAAIELAVVSLREARDQHRGRIEAEKVAQFHDAEHRRAAEQADELKRIALELVDDGPSFGRDVAREHIARIEVLRAIAEVSGPNLVVVIALSRVAPRRGAFARTIGPELEAAAARRPDSKDPRIDPKRITTIGRWIDDDWREDVTIAAMDRDTLRSLLYWCGLANDATSAAIERSDALVVCTPPVGGARLQVHVLGVRRAQGDTSIEPAEGRAARSVRE